MHAVVATGIRKRYGAVEAVAGINLRVREGEVVAMLGPNGAGKTTTIELLLGLRRPSGGTVRVLGGRPDDRSVRGRIGAMLQDSEVPPGMTVTEVVRLIGRYYPYALPVDDVLRRADLLSRRRCRIGELSGGQRQRLSFAMAIVGDPDLLFLDEPTAALDVESRRAFWAEVRGFADLGKTILFSTHNLAEADTFAERVIVIHRGAVLQDGTPGEIKARVAAKTVRLRTDAPAAEVRRIAGVTHVEHTLGGGGGAAHLVIRTSTPERLLYQLLAGGRSIADLTVVETDLESAFLHLTSDPEAAA
jgi:ABC-2 type transport system ATP-binding protein